MTRVITVKLPDPEELDECMLPRCSRPAIPGTKWARYCSRHQADAAPTENEEDMSYAVYRARVRERIDSGE